MDPMVQALRGQQGQPDPLLDQFAALQRRQGEISARREQAYQPADRAQMEQVYQSRAEGSPRQLMLALAAQEAGKEFQPMQAHFLKQAAARIDPMKMTGGTMAPEGFIEDPEYARNMNISRIDAQGRDVDRDLATNVGAQERRSAAEQRAADLMEREKQRAADAMERQRERLAGQIQLRGIPTPGKAGGAGGGRILPANQVQNLTEGQNKAGTIQRLSNEFKPEFSGVGGMLSTAAGKIPGVDTAAADWWRNYSKESELIERHGLFGAALTPTEQQSWREADIRPKMSPDAIKRNLARRAEIMQRHQDYVVGNFRKSGYDTTAFDPISDEPPEIAAPAAPAAGGGKYPEGTTIVNPQTGVKMIRRGGKWEPA